VIDTPQIVQTPDQLMATIHLTVPRSEMRSVMGPGLNEIMTAVKAQGIGPAGPWFTHFINLPPESFDFEICVPVGNPVTPVGRVESGKRPAGEVIRTVYHGPYEGLSGAWREFDAWIAANGHKACADLYQCYVAGPESSPDPATWRTELSRPVVR
jgi:effector-binding domain-containing protein